MFGRKEIEIESSRFLDWGHSRGRARQYGARPRGRWARWLILRWLILRRQRFRARGRGRLRSACNGYEENTDYGCDEKPALMDMNHCGPQPSWLEVECQEKQYR